MVLPLAAFACKSSPDAGSIQILTVDDPFPGPPAATEILVQSVDYDDGGPDGAVRTLASGPASQGTLDLGIYDETNTESIVVTATDGAGTRVAWGETLPVELGAIAGVTLGVFVQRTGLLSRMPGPHADGRPAPLVTVLGGRYILVAGGADSASATQTRLYDLVSWAPLSNPPVLPFAPESLAVAQLQALAIDSTQASWYDLTTSTTTAATAPSGTGSWADVAGGATISSTDQSTSFVVGATRTTGAPTSTVLIVASTGTLTWATLTTPRLGATAAWVDGLGLIVEGGNVDTASAGVEYLSASSTNGPIPFAYPSDATTGAGMTALDGTHVLVVGGGEAGAGGVGARVLTVPCGATTPCTTTPWQATLPSALTLAQALTIDTSTAFVTGEDASGAMHAYRLSATSVAEIPFRIPRSHARAVRLPLGLGSAAPIALVGGNPTIESFIP